MALSGQWDPLVTFCSVDGPERSALNFNVDIKGIAVWLGECVQGIDLEGHCDSAEPGCDGGCEGACEVLALLLGLLGNA